MGISVVTFASAQQTDYDLVQVTLHMGVDTWAEAQDVRDWVIASTLEQADVVLDDEDLAMSLTDEPCYLKSYGTELTYA